MKNWEEIVIGPEDSISTALIRIDSSGTQFALVLSSERRLLGTATDGDIRRGLLKGMQLSESISKCMNAEPQTATLGTDDQAIVALMRKQKLRQLPIVDSENRVVGIKILEEFILPASRENWVVLMAGGLGTRLGELTKNTPKPMLRVGDKPLLETIINTFIEQGFTNFYLSVNYRADIIEGHFGDGRKFGANIRYIHEKERAGTAGSLSLIPEQPAEPLIVANGDLLAKIDYAHMLDVHVDTNAAATMGVSEYEFQVPYGVVEETNGVIFRIVEKPLHKSLVSAGVYVLSPSVLAHVPENTFFDMPSLFEKLIAQKLKAVTYKVHGYWLDIGQIPDYHKANDDIDSVYR